MKSWKITGNERFYIHNKVTIVKKLTNWKPIGKRPVGKPKNRWIDGTLRDME
jgi:hypothetical protein